MIHGNVLLHISCVMSYDVDINNINSAGKKSWPSGNGCGCSINRS